MTLLRKYIQAALKEAKYTFDEESNSCIAVVEKLPGCWAQGDNLEDAREELESVIEGWILLSIQRGEEIPSVSGVNFNIPHPQKELKYA